MAREKKWLFDKGKTSKSRKRWSYGGDFANERNTKQFRDIEDAPKKAGMKTGKVFNNRLSFRPLRRFLRNKVGKDWNQIYSEIKERIPADIWEYHNPAEWYVYTKVEILSDGSIVNTKSRGVHRTLVSPDGIHAYNRYSHYYVHPDTNELCYLKGDTSHKEKVSYKEGKKKHAEFKVKRNKENKSWKENNEKKSSEAAIIMKNKKQLKNKVDEN